jgi:hypothetical protein
VPVVVWFACANAFFGFGRVEAAEWTKPSTFASETRPGGRRGKHLASPLGMQGERPDGHVAIVIGNDHVPHVGNLLGGELGGRCVRATGPIVEGAMACRTGPSVEAGRGEAQHAEGDGERESFLGVCKGGQDGALGVAIGHPKRVEAETGQADKEEGQADDGKEEPDPALEGEDLGLEFLLVEGEDLGGDDGTGAATDPTCGGGTRDTEVTEQHGVAFLADEVAHAVVIRTTAG